MLSDSSKYLNDNDKLKIDPFSYSLYDSQPDHTTSSGEWATVRVIVLSAQWTFDYLIILHA